MRYQHALVPLGFRRKVRWLTQRQSLEPFPSLTEIKRRVKRRTSGCRRSRRLTRAVGAGRGSWSRYQPRPHAPKHAAEANGRGGALGSRVAGRRGARDAPCSPIRTGLLCAGVCALPTPMWHSDAEPMYVLQRSPRSCTQTILARSRHRGDRLAHLPPMHCETHRRLRPNLLASSTAAKDEARSSREQCPALAAVPQRPRYQVSGHEKRSKRSATCYPADAGRSCWANQARIAGS